MKSGVQSLEFYITGIIAMCTVMLVPETLQTQMTPAAVARKQVDELIRQEQDAILEYRMTKDAPDAMPPIPAGNIFVWFDRACYGNGGLLLCPLPFGQIMVLLCV